MRGLVLVVCCKRHNGQWLDCRTKDKPTFSFLSHTGSCVRIVVDSDQNR